MAADRGVDPSTTTCERSAHLLAPSHPVAVTIFTVGLAAWPYWQYALAECWGVGVGRAQRVLRAIPIVGPFVLARDIGQRVSDPFVTLRSQIDLYAVAVLQLAWACVLANGLANWHPTSFGWSHPWAGISLLLAHLTYVRPTYGLILIAAVSAVFMSDIQTSLRDKEDRCGQSDRHLYGHLWINSIAFVGGIAVLSALLTLHGDRSLLLLITFAAAFAYVNGSRQRSGHHVFSTFAPRTWVHTAARHGGLLAGIGLIALSMFLLNMMLDVNEDVEQGIGIGMFVDARHLQSAVPAADNEYATLLCATAAIRCPATEIPVVYPYLDPSNRIELNIDVPLARSAHLAFVLTKFRAKTTSEGISNRVLGNAVPACDASQTPGETQPITLYASTLTPRDGPPQAVFSGELAAARAVRIHCSFTDTAPDILTSTFTLRRVSFSSCCADDGILPAGPDRTPSKLKFDLHMFLANSDVMILGGMLDPNAPYDQRVRLLSGFNAADVLDRRTQPELAVQWTERGTAQSRDFTLIVSASLLGVALVCILEWLRPQINKFARHRPRSAPRPQ